MLLTAALLLGLFAGFAPAARAAGVDITEKFTDPNFRAAVYEAIGKKAPAPIFDSDVAGVTELDMSWMDIYSLVGLEYFKGLQTLLCYNNLLTSLPALPSGLTYLDCDFNELSSLPTLPFGLTDLICYHNHLTVLPTLPSSLSYLQCGGNQFTSLPTLPPKLADLDCSGGQLASLPALPSGLKHLYCGINQLTSLPALPIGLTILCCPANRLTELDVSGLSSLESLDCTYNEMIVPDDVKGFTGIWDGCDFRFSPQLTVPPPLDGLSDWAVKEVTALNAIVVLPDALKNDFQKPIRRDEFTAVLIKVYILLAEGDIGSSDTPFTDISDSPYKTAIEIAYEYHLVDGTSPTKFTPAGLLTREQTAKLLYTMVEKIKGTDLNNTATPTFTDNAKISPWAVPCVAFCQQNNIMQGTSTGKFDPQGNLTREQAMLVVERLIVQYGW